MAECFARLDEWVIQVSWSTACLCNKTIILLHCNVVEYKQDFLIFIPDLERLHEWSLFNIQMNFNTKGNELDADYKGNLAGHN